MAGELIDMDLEEEIRRELSSLPSHIEGTRQHFQRKLERKIELYRQDINRIEVTPMKLREYQLVESEAFEFLNLTDEEQDQQKKEDWPLLAASVGTDYLHGKKRYVFDLREAAITVQEQVMKLNRSIVESRKERKKLIDKIRNTNSREKAARLYIQYHPEYNERLRGDNGD